MQNKGRASAAKQVPWALIALLWMVFAHAQSAPASQTIYRCLKDGHLTLTDQPCEGPKRPGSGNGNGKGSGNGNTPDAQMPQPSGPPSAPEGAWRGVAQLSATLAGKPVALSPATNQINLQIAPDGTVTGSLREQACEFRGQLGDVYDAGDRAIRFVASGCHEANLNLSYSGTLQLAASGKPSRLAVSGLSGFIAGKNPVAASMRADLSRDSASSR